MNELLTYSGKRLAEMIRKGLTTSVEVVQAHIEQIQSVNPTINAVVVDRFSQALKEAKKADQKFKKSGPKGLPPLHGVPCTIKEAFATKGMPQTAGVVSRKEMVSSADAITVTRLKKAGAIPLGVTNVPELCLWIETYNCLYGRTNNPYNPKRIAGGSSGGEAAIIAAGGSPFGLASDIAGSIRLPAFFNGVFGHKPTSTLIPNTGQFPVPHKEAMGFLTPGPIARRAEDLMPLLRILAGPDGVDEDCIKWNLQDETSIDISKLTVLNVESDGAHGISKDLRRIQHQAAKALASLGAQVESTSFTGLQNSRYIWISMMTEVDPPSVDALLGKGQSLNPIFEIPRWALRRSRHTLPLIGVSLVENLLMNIPIPKNKGIQLGQKLREEMLKQIGPQGVMLYPTFPKVAPLHYTTLVRPFDWAYCGIFNVFGFPVTQVPLGLNADGLPLGIQVVGVPGQDHLTIAVACALEKAFGGWVPPWEAALRPSKDKRHPSHPGLRATA